MSTRLVAWRGEYRPPPFCPSPSPKSPSPTSTSDIAIKQGAGVIDTPSCANVCSITAGCTFSEYRASDSGLCTLKKNAFYGPDGTNGPNVTVSGLCLAAPGAPEILSGFGKGGIAMSGVAKTGSL